MFAILRDKQGRCSGNIGCVVNEEEGEKQNKDYKARVRIKVGCSQQKREGETRKIENTLKEKRMQNKIELC